MKKTAILLLALVMVCAGAAVVMAKVAGTPHDLHTGNAAEICAFCHTPHGGSTTQAPLWNRSQATQTYTYYTSATFDMTPVATGQPGIGSAGCLVCHNGVASTLVNYPGPGSTTNTDYGFTMTSGVTSAENFALLGTDLSNDHPISFTYAPSLDQDNNGFPTAGSNGWIPGQVSTGAGGNYKLYGSSKNQFECATCHAVHNTNTNATYVSHLGTWDQANRSYSSLPAANEVYFLRTSNTGSKMCMDCHVNR